jgi:hypothetical protein
VGIAVIDACCFASWRNSGGMPAPGWKPLTSTRPITTAMPETTVA